MFESDADGIDLVTVAAYSVLRNADKSKPVRLLVAHDDSFLEAGGREKMESLVARFPSASVVFSNFMPIYRSHAALLERGGTRWPPMVWGWVFAAELFPEVSGRLVYIDLDTYTTGDLQELFDLDLASGGYLAAMVVDTLRPEGDYCNVKWTVPDRALFNTGVVVMDVDAWRREGVSLKMAEWFAAHKSDALFLEQDAANFVCQRRILRLPLKWNTNDNNLKWVGSIDLKGGSLLVEDLHSPVEVLEAIVEPKIIHYMFKHKPHRYNHRPERNRFRRAMMELGMIRYALPGENPLRMVEGWLYDAWYAWLKRRARRMLAAFRAAAR